MRSLKLTRTVRRAALLLTLGATALGGAMTVTSCSGADATAPLQPTGGAATIVITPNATSLVVGATLPLQAVAHDASGNVVSDAAIHWSSSDTGVATVSSTGVVTAKGIGTAQIAASADGRSAIATLSVVAVPVASVAVAPTSGSIVTGGTMSLTAITYDASGNALSNRAVVWASSAPQVATVDNAGKVTAVASGTATITATSEGKVGSAQITVTPPAPTPVASVVVTPGSKSLSIGGTVTLAATTLDASGKTLTGRAVTWATSNASIATVTTSGVVTAIGAGTATITATSGGQSGTATITVTAPSPDATPSPPPAGAKLTSLVVTPANAVMQSGQTLDFSATPLDQYGHVMSNISVSWSSSTPKVASVHTLNATTGRVSAIKSGYVTITATAGGVSTDVPIAVF